MCGCVQCHVQGNHHMQLANAFAVTLKSSKRRAKVCNENWKRRQNA